MTSASPGQSDIILIYMYSCIDIFGKKKWQKNSGERLIVRSCHNDKIQKTLMVAANIYVTRYHETQKYL